jgi:hypothetical protein
MQIRPERKEGERGDWWHGFTVLVVEGRVLLVVKEAVTPSCRSSELSLVSAIQVRKFVDPACISQVRIFANPRSRIQPKKRREKVT